MPSPRLPTPCTALTELIAALDELCEPNASAVCPTNLRRILSAYAIVPAAHLTSTQLAGSPDKYVRHVLHGDPNGRYTVVAIIWRAGHHTPVHGHFTWCGYRVLTGSLVEEQFRCGSRDGIPNTARLDRVVKTRSIDLAPGHVATTAAGRGYPHRLAHGGGSPAVSLHIYGVSQKKVCSNVKDIVDFDDQAAALA